MSLNAAARAIVGHLGLAPLPEEGGWFRQTWGTTAGSAIYFLLTPDDFSALHRLRTPELWHFHAGDAVEHLQLDPRTGAAAVGRLGIALGAGEVPQFAVPGGVWQGARLAAGGAHGYALLTCTMAPPWNAREFELGGRTALTRAFPGESARIAALTRG
jgi:hypothetical protein